MKEFPILNLPPADLRLSKEDGVVKVFDRLRSKWVVLTPEEWVRQHFTHWLNHGLHYPESLTANEAGLIVNGMRKRCDTVVFRKEGSPLLVVEYKAPSVEITQSVFDQIVRYNMTLHAEYLVVSNGINHYCCKMDYARDTYHFIRQIPDYHSICFPNSEN